MQHRLDTGCATDAAAVIMDQLDEVFGLIRAAYHLPVEREAHRQEVVDGLRRVLVATENVRALTRSYLYSLGALRLTHAARRMEPGSQLPSDATADAQTNDDADPLAAFMREQSLSDPRIRR